ncbi:hypothetical protein ACMD2_24915, partial [Ananas comosus]
VEAAYDMLLMQSLSQRRSGKVANSSIRYADVKPVRSAGTGPMPQWVQSTMKNIPVSIEPPSPSNLAVQAGVYGAMMVFTFASGTSANIPATEGSSDHCWRTCGGCGGRICSGELVTGGYRPLFWYHYTAVIVSEFILFSQLLVSLYLR